MHIIYYNVRRKSNKRRCIRFLMPLEQESLYYYYTFIYEFIMRILRVFHSIYHEKNQGKQQHYH